MPVMSTHKQSDMEKRLKLLNIQLYGKEIESKNSLPKTPLHQGFAGQATNNVSDFVYLKKDLSKIVLLASLAIGAELILYFSKLLDKIKFF